MLPSLSVTQSVKMAAVSADGATVEEQTTKFGPLSARVTNPLQAMWTSVRSSWQPPDERAAMGEWNVWVERLIPTRSGQEICQGHARLLVDEQSAAEGNVCVHALDAHGQRRENDSRRKRKNFERQKNGLFQARFFCRNDNFVQDQNCGREQNNKRIKLWLFGRKKPKRRDRDKARGRARRDKTREFR